MNGMSSLSNMTSMPNIMDIFQQNLGMSFILLVIFIIAYWRIFEKAGEAGWKSIIPIYNVYILWKIAGLSFWKFFLISFAFGFIIPILSGVAISSGSGILGILITILSIAFFIYVIVTACKLCKNLSNSFGYGTGFAIGLFFLMPIFLLILAFISNTYNKIG